MKNKIVWVVTLLIMGSVWNTIPEYSTKAPEDNNLSSGYSVLKSTIGGIDNYSNVYNYNYKSNVKSRSTTTASKLKDLSFWFMDYIDIYQNAEEMENVEGYPQGMCFTDDYMFLTFYTKEKDIPGQLKVFDRTTGLCVLVLGLDGDSHLGGIACDGENVWICNSAKMSLERISYKTIVSMVKENEGQFVDFTENVDSYPVKTTPSCIAYYNEALWIGTHTISTSSNLMKYVYDEDSDSLAWVSLYRTPSKVQGVSFDENGAVYLSVSYGRNSSSFVKKYTSVEKMTANIDGMETMIEMPPCSEGLVWEDEKLHVLFESAAKKYLEGTDGHGACIAPLDRILVIDLASP